MDSILPAHWSAMLILVGATLLFLCLAWWQNRYRIEFQLGLTARDGGMRIRRIGGDDDDEAHTRLPLGHELNVSTVVQMALTFVLLIACLFVILSKHYEPSDKHWAFGTIGTLIGYWFKPSDTRRRARARRPKKAPETE